MEFPRSSWVVVIMSGKGGVDIRAGGISEDEVEDVRRGEGGYDGEAVASQAGGGPGGEASVQQKIAALEAKIKEMEAQMKKDKKTEAANSNW